MSLIGFRLPVEAGLLLEQAEVPGDRESSSDFHVTSVYPGRSTPVVTLAKILVVVQRVSERFGPFDVTLADIASFPAGDDGVPVICPVDSPEMHAFHHAVKAGLDAAGVPYSKKWPEYKPHVTLSYVRDGSVKEVVGKLASPVSFTLYGASLWGDEGCGMIRAEVPFPASPIQRMAARLLG